jgi:antitoxin component YwqK of YwqJK toxin-antitoxin module
MLLNNLIEKIKSISPNIKFVGSFDENNKRTGYWETYYTNGNPSRKGIYVNGKRDGNWEIYWSNGNLMWKGNYVNGFRHGYWEEYWFNGELNRRGNYVNGKLFSKGGIL